MNYIPTVEKIEILSLDGRIVRILDHLPDNSISTEKGKLPSGIYLVRFHSDKSYVSRVIIK